MKKTLLGLFVLAFVLVGCGQKMDYTDPETYTSYIQESYNSAKDAFTAANPDIDLTQYADQATEMGTAITDAIDNTIDNFTSGLSTDELETQYNEFTGRVDAFFDGLTMDNAKETFKNVQETLNI